MKWIQLDTDFQFDPRIRAVTRVLGVEGTGALVGIWCHVARHGSYPGKAIDSAGRPLPLADLRESSGLDKPKFDQLIDICVASGHFNPDVWRQQHGIWIPAMERRADTYAKRALAKKQGDFNGIW